MSGPRPIGVVASVDGLYSRTVELSMVRIDALPRLEGAQVVLFSGVLGKRGTVMRRGMSKVQAVRHREDGGIEVLVPDTLTSLFAGAAAGDGVYLANDVEDHLNKTEAAYVEAWKAERRQR